MEKEEETGQQARRQYGNGSSRAAFHTSKEQYAMCYTGLGYKVSGLPMLHRKARFKQP